MVSCLGLRSGVVLVGLLGVGLVCLADGYFRLLVMLVVIVGFARFVRSSCVGCR